MLEFAANTITVVTLPHQYAGETLTLTDLQFEVTDASGEVLLARATPGTFNSSNTSTDVTIDATYNQTDEKVDIRVINVFLTSATGTYTYSIFYKLLGDQLKLTVMTDSFMTFAESMLVRTKITQDMSSYDDLDQNVQAIALSNSYIALTKLTYIDGCKKVCNIGDYTPEQFNALSTKFKDTIKKAQLLEANGLVEANPTIEKIHSGIKSETIGDVSVTFDSASLGFKLKGISDNTYDVLSGILFKDSGSSQTWILRRS